MYEWTDSYEDEYLKERIAQIMAVQKDLAEKGQTLCSTYEQFWLPSLNDLPDVTYLGQERYRTPYGDFNPIPGSPFHGALAFTPKSSAEIPPVLHAQRDWLPATGTLDLGGRSLRIEAGELAVTFTGVNLNLRPHELLRDANRELVRSGAGVYLWQITPDLEHSNVGSNLYPDGNVPTLSNAHTRADVTGYAILAERPYQHTLVYIGLAAHKTSIESLWASLIRGRAGASLRGTPVLADGDVKLLSTPLPDFGVVHAGIIVRKALPGLWEAGEDCAYALVSEEGVDVEATLQRVTLKRLQETLAFPLPDEWAGTIWTHALEAGFVQRLETGGDCRGGVRIDLGKDWKGLVQGLLEQDLVKV